MFRSSKAEVAPPSDRLVSHQRWTSGPPPLPAFRVFKMSSSEDDGNFRGQPTSLVSSSSASTSSTSCTDTVAPPSPSGDVRRSDAPPTKLGIHHQWLAQIQHAVRSASGRYRKQRRAASIDQQQQQQQQQQSTKVLSASSSLDRAAFKNRKLNTASLTNDERQAIVKNNGLNDDVIRSHANKYYTVSEGARGVIVEMKRQPEAGSTAATSPKAKNGTAFDVSDCRASSVAEAGTRSTSRDPSPMTSSGYASDGMYTCRRRKLTDDLSIGEEHVIEKQFPAAGDPSVTAGYRPLTTPVHLTIVTAGNNGTANAISRNISACVNTQNCQREIPISKTENHYTSGLTSSSSAIRCGAKYGDSISSAQPRSRRPVYENLFKEACGTTREREFNDAGNNRRYSMLPGSLQHRTTDAAETRRLSMGSYLQPVLADNSERVSRKDWQMKNQIDTDAAPVPPSALEIGVDASIYENDTVTSRPSLGNHLNGSGAFDRTVLLSPVYENDSSSTLVLDESTMNQSHHQRSFHHLKEKHTADRSRISESAMAADGRPLLPVELSFHEARDRSLMTTSFRFLPPLPVPKFDTEENADEKTTDWDDRLSTLSLGCRRKKRNASVPREADASEPLTSQRPGNDQPQDYMNLPRRNACKVDGRRVTAAGCCVTTDGVGQRQRNRTRRRRLLFGARMLPSDMTVESVDADLEPLDRDLVERRLHQPITNKISSASDEQWDSWRKTALWVGAMPERKKQARVFEQQDDNIYESIGDLQHHVYNNLNYLPSDLQVPIKRSSVRSPPPPVPPPPVPARPRTGLASTSLTPSSSLPSLYELPLCPTEIVDLDSDHVYTIADVLASFRALAAHLPRAERFVAELQASARASASLERRQHGRRHDVVVDDDRRGQVPVTMRSRHRPRQVKERAAERSGNAQSAVTAPMDSSSTAYFRSRSADCSGNGSNDRSVDRRPSPPPPSKLVTTTVRDIGDLVETGKAIEELTALSSVVLDSQRVAYRRSFRAMSSAQFPQPPTRSNMSLNDDAGSQARRRTTVELICSPGNWLSSNGNDISDDVEGDTLTRPPAMTKCGVQPDVAKVGTVEQRPADDLRQVKRHNNGRKPAECSVGDDEDKENTSVRLSSNANKVLGGGLFVRRTMASSSLRCSKKYRKSRETDRFNASVITRSGNDTVISQETTFADGGLCISEHSNRKCRSVVDASGADGETNIQQFRKPFQTLPVNIARRQVESHLLNSPQWSGKNGNTVQRTSQQVSARQINEAQFTSKESAKSFAVNIADCNASFIDAVNDARKLNPSARSECRTTVVDLREDLNSSSIAIGRQGATVPGLSAASSAKHDMEIVFDNWTTSGNARPTTSDRNSTMTLNSSTQFEDPRLSAQIRWAQGSNPNREIFC